METRDPFIYKGSSGRVSFISIAPLETISAQTTSLSGAIDSKTRNVYFKVAISSFLGFNSALQREHFNENYMESTVFPESSFSGRILEEVSFQTAGSFDVHAKGNLTIHGISVERIIEGRLQVQNGKIILTTQFPVLLQDHAITIPRIVEAKISREVMVTVEMELSNQ